MTTSTLDAAALDAINRLDDGLSLPGDKALADRYDLLLQDAQDRYSYAADMAERTMRLAGECPGCVPGGFGVECDTHYADWDRKIARTVDL